MRATERYERAWNAFQIHLNHNPKASLIPFLKERHVNHRSMHRWMSEKGYSVRLAKQQIRLLQAEARTFHLEADNEQEVQCDIQKRGYRKEYERSTAVAQCTEDRCKNVVKHSYSYSAEDYDYVVICVIYDIIGSFCQHEHISREYHGERCHHDGYYHR